MSVRIRGREVQAEVRPVRNGFFLRAAIHAVFGLQAGSIVEVNGSPYVAKYIIAGEPTDPETWAIVLPVRNRVTERPEAVSMA